MDDLLASLVASQGWPPEPVATESLVHLLRRPQARAAFGRWADALVPGLAATDLEYAGQVVRGDAEGRPDVVGSSGSEARVVIEAKFAAPLTAAQTSGAYIDHLAGSAPGLLVYLVPTDRVAAMWSAVLHMHAGSASLDLPSGPHRLITAGGHVVTVLKWADLLDLLGPALVVGPAAGDLAQLRGLVEWRSATQWVPILPDDLTDRVGRQIAGLSQVVVRAANAALPGKAAAGTSDWGPGRHLVTHDGQHFWVGLWYLAWGNRGCSPVWAAAKPTTTTLESLRSAVAGAINRPAFIEGKWVTVPLYLAVGDEEEAAEQRLRADIVAFADALDAVGVATTVDDNS